MEKINLDLFDNRYYEIKKTKEQFVDICYLDFKYESNWIEKKEINGLEIFKKRFNLNKHIIKNFDFENIKKEIDKEFGLMLSKMGEENRISDINEKLDGDNLISKLKNISNFIAIEGRIGPAHWILSNQKTYDWIVKKLNLSEINNDILFIDNLAVDVNESIDDDVLLVGRKNKIDQPGLACVILTDDDNNIIFEEDEKTKEISIFFTITNIGFFPHKQYMKINIIHD